jgi:putative transposase
MARLAASQIREPLTSILSPRVIRQAARRLGVVRRERKVDVVALVQVLVLGFDGARRRTIAGFRRSYELATGVTLAPSAFYDRLTPALAQLLRELTLRAFDQLGAKARRMHLALSEFLEVFIADGSLVRLGDALEPWYPSVWTHHTKASAKLHVIMDAATRTPRSFELHPGKCHDVTLVRIGPWVKDRLLIGDLAYYQGKLFRAIQQENGYFLCRVKERANFVVVGSDDPAEVGRRLRAVLHAHRGETVDVEVDYAYRHIIERDFVFRHLRLRVVGDWHEKEQRHRVYVTNASPTQLAVQHVAAVYALRWEIELLFRELKTVYRIDQMPTSRKSVTECLLYAALLTLAVSRRLHRAVTRTRHRIVELFPIERWAAVFGRAARDLLQLLRAPRLLRVALEYGLTRVLRHEALDPNRSRLPLAARAQLGILRARAAPA